MTDKRERGISPMMAIRKKCLDCTAGQFQEVKACPVLSCPLWMFRTGKNPNCGNNASNPYLVQEFFHGKENQPASMIIESIENVRTSEAIE